jgi:hypothetical protein
MFCETEGSFLVIALAVCLKKKEKKKRGWTKGWLKEGNEYNHQNVLKGLRISEPK